VEKPFERKQMRFRFPELDRSGRIVVQIAGLSHNFGEKVGFSPVATCPHLSCRGPCPVLETPANSVHPANLVCTLPILCARCKFCTLNPKLCLGCWRHACFLVCLPPLCLQMLFDKARLEITRGRRWPSLGPTGAARAPSCASSWASVSRRTGTSRWGSTASWPTTSSRTRWAPLTARREKKHQAASPSRKRQKRPLGRRF